MEENHKITYSDVDIDIRSQHGSRKIICNIISTNVYCDNCRKCKKKICLRVDKM